MPIEARRAAVILALGLLSLGVALGGRARYQVWAWRHPRAASLGTGVLVGAFVACVWVGALGQGEGPATLAASAAAAAATATTHRRLTR